MLDAAIVGGGLVGLSSALALARRGVKVRVVDRGDAGAQASWAAAGILGPQSEVHAPSPMLELCRKSFEMYPDFTRGMEVGFRRNGTLHLAFTEEEAHALDEMRRWQSQAGLRIEERKHPAARLALFFPDEGQVDNRRLLQALRDTCAREGVAVEQGAVARLDDVDADQVVLCAGSWSAQLAPELPVQPVRGQLLAVDAHPPPCVIFGAGGYAVPRATFTLVGATAEKVGFDATPTPEGRAHLEKVAAKLLDRSGPVVDHWAGLRPGTPDGLPIFGRLSNRVIVATGHYRNGVLLAPISGQIVASLFHGETTPVDLAPFEPKRYSKSPPGRPT